MKTIKDTVHLTLNYEKGELLDGKWLPYVHATRKLRKLEKQGTMAYRELTNRFYNSFKASKYNTAVIAGFNCIDVNEPMRTSAASLVVAFEEGSDGQEA